MMFLMGMLGILFTLSGFTYWITFLFCGSMIIWSWTKWGMYQMKLKF